MSYIPQAMSGREIQHDIKFAAEGPMSGLVDGVQSITMSGDVDLTLTEGDDQLKCHILQVDPGGAARTLKLPGYANADLNLVGRRITIINGASDAGELITLQDANSAFICYVGYLDSVELVVLSQNTSNGSIEYGLLTKEFQHSVTGSEDAASIEILPAVTEKSFAVKFVQFTKNSGAASTLAGATITNDSVALITTGASVTLDETVAEGFYPAEADEISAGQALSYAKGTTSSTAGITIKVIYSLV